ncbi:hypothetical protein K501DRAFT_279089 [Backusella circina FSU 941]|nr:hypothetical protein K501DRAFT_279089 [Backusella circina FSU 941]
MACNDPSLAAAAESSLTLTSSTTTLTPTYIIENSTGVVESLPYYIDFFKQMELKNNWESCMPQSQKLIKKLFILLKLLPSFKKIEEISELELTTNYLHPVLSTAFHNPERLKNFLCKKNRLILTFFKLNRKEESTSSFCPEAVMKHYDKKLFGAALGYCEVNFLDAQNDVESLYTDLIRLALF